MNEDQQLTIGIFHFDRVRLLQKKSKSSHRGASKSVRFAITLANANGQPAQTKYIPTVIASAENNQA